jgi:hypothetical protein
MRGFSGHFANARERQKSIQSRWQALENGVKKHNSPNQLDFQTSKTLQTGTDRKNLQKHSP